MKTPIGALALAAFCGVALAVGATALQVHRTTHPRHFDRAPIDFEAMQMALEQVEFPAADGRPTRGWWIGGEAGRPPVILCHDLGSDKSSLINLALDLRGHGFPVLSIDFRGHGDDAGGSTLGLDEKRDIVGAVDYLAGRGDLDARIVGVYGVGMGAHAAVLAAAERPRIKVLVLDRLYPDPSYRLVRGVYPDWEFAVEHMDFLPRGMYVVMNGFRLHHQRAAEVIERLVGRHVLLLAPKADAALVEEITRMYETIPDQVDADGNLVVLGATQGDGLYGDALVRYHQRVVGFFLDRLADHGGATPRPGV